MGKTVKLILVSAENNNKFYDMAENSDGTFTATYGRVEKTKQTTTYPMSKWDSTYRSKTRKGYTDITELYLDESTKDPNKTKWNTSGFTSAANILGAAARGTGKAIGSAVTVTNTFNINGAKDPKAISDEVSFEMGKVNAWLQAKSVGGLVF